MRGGRGLAGEEVADEEAGLQLVAFYGLDDVVGQGLEDVFALEGVLCGVEDVGEEAGGDNGAEEDTGAEVVEVHGVLVGEAGYWLVMWRML